jgi:DivIVA domain-containing protein
MNRIGYRLFPPFAQAEPETDDELPREAVTNDDVEMTAFHIRSRRFGRRRFGGFDPEEVTAFLDDVAEALYLAQMRHIEVATQLKLVEDELKVLTIKQASLPPSDAFSPADQPATSMGRHNGHQDDGAAHTRLENLRSTALQEVEALLHDAQLQAQALTDAAQERAATILREADALKAQRQKQADQLLAEATVTAESILMTARDQEASLRGELSRLAESRLRMLDDVWATLNGCQEWLSMADPRRQRPEAQDDGLDRVA